MNSCGLPRFSVPNKKSGQFRKLAVPIKYYVANSLLMFLRIDMYYVQYTLVT